MKICERGKASLQRDSQAQAALQHAMGGVVSRNRSGLRGPGNDVFEPEKLSLHIIENQSERFFILFDRYNMQTLDGNFLVGIAEIDQQPTCCPQMVDLNNGNLIDANFYGAAARKTFSDCSFTGARHHVLSNSLLQFESTSPPSDSVMLPAPPLTRDRKLLNILEHCCTNYRGAEFGAPSMLTGSNLGISPRELWHVPDSNEGLHLKQISQHMIPLLQGLLSPGAQGPVKILLALVGAARVMHDLEDLESMQRRSSVDSSLLQRPRAASMESHLPLSFSQPNVNPYIQREISISRSGSGHGPRLLTHHNSSHQIRASPPAFQQTEAVEDAGLRHSYDGRAMKRLSQKRLLAQTSSLPSLHGGAGRGTQQQRMPIPAIGSGGHVPTTGMSPPPTKQKTPVLSPREQLTRSSSDEEVESPGSTPSGSVIGIQSPPFQFTPPGSLLGSRSVPLAVTSRTAPLFPPSPSASASEIAIDVLNEFKIRRVIDAIIRTISERRQTVEQVRDVEWSGE